MKIHESKFRELILPVATEILMPSTNSPWIKFAIGGAQAVAVSPFADSIIGNDGYIDLDMAEAFIDGGFAQVTELDVSIFTFDASDGKRLLELTRQYAE